MLGRNKKYKDKVPTDNGCFLVLPYKKMYFVSEREWSSFEELRT